jgi:hypothetical protein
MFTRKFARWIVALTPVLFVAALLVFMPVQVSAAQPADASDNSCLTCHENLYYLHDMGCWYCMTEAHKDRCVDCHEGNLTSMKVEESHLGMFPHPQENGGAKCLECHEQSELASVLETFEANGGFDVVIKAESHAPAVAAESGFPEVAEPIIEWKWAVGASVLFGLWLVLVLFSPLKP